jgi:hypothetical protein
MVAGVGSIGALASILSSLLVLPAAPDSGSATVTSSGVLANDQDIAALRGELAAIRQSLERLESR